MGWKKKTGLAVASFFGFIIIFSITISAIEQQQLQQARPFTTDDFIATVPHDPLAKQRMLNDLNCQSDGYGQPCKINPP